MKEINYTKQYLNNLREDNKSSSEMIMGDSKNGMMDGNRMDLRSDSEIYLENEKNRITKDLDNFANKKMKEAMEDEKFFNMSLRDLMNRFLEVWNVIIIEIIDYTKKSNFNIFNIIDEYKNKYWWESLFEYFKGIFIILTKKDRLIYVGIMCIIISIFLYYIVISS